MTKNSEAIRLAEASDWKGLQRLIEKAPEYAQECGDYGMLPIHWACTESHVPVSLLSRLLTAYPHGAKVKNDAELLPLHIAIRARVEPEWLERLLVVYPHAVHVDAPDGVSVMDLAHQVGLHADGLKILRSASEDVQSHDGQVFDLHCGDHPELDDWEPLSRESVLAKVAPLDNELPPTFGRGSSGNNNTPVSPAHSLMNDDTDDDHLDHAALAHPHSLSPPRGRLVSTFSSPSSDGSANTAPIPRTAPPRNLQMQSLFHRKHSLDFHAQTAAAAETTRQHQEMMARGINTRAMSMLGGRHASLPTVPSFEQLRFHYPYEQHHLMDSRSSDEESQEDNNDMYRYRSSSLRTSRGSKKRAAIPIGGRSFESPPEWKRDDECSICRASFGMFKHRHHCRNCGKSICRQHSADKKIMMESKGFTTPQRVCVTCYAMITHKQSKQASHQYDAMLHGPKISGPVAAFHQQMQQQQMQGGRSTGGTGVSSPGSIGNGSARSSASTTAANPTTNPTTMTTSSTVNGTVPKDKSHEMYLMQAHMNELRHVVAVQQKQIEQLTQTNMQMQQQILEQEELKAETMLLITQLMTRVSVLEINNHSTDDPNALSDADDD